MEDNINPPHYRNGEIDCITALEAATVNKKGSEAICVANVIKYLWRYENKNGIEDVKKAKWYLDRLISELEKKESIIPTNTTSKLIIDASKNQEREFKVGDRYRHKEGFDIEIVATNGSRIHYLVLYGKGSGVFNIESDFAKELFKIF
jgi:hypothetical protein